MQYNCRDSGPAAGGEPSESTGVPRAEKKLIRTIKVKLLLTEMQREFYSRYIDDFCACQDYAVNAYLAAGGPNKINNEKIKEVKDYLVSKGYFSGARAPMDTAIGSHGAISYLRAMRKRVRSKLQYKEGLLSSMEDKLTLPRSVWFNPQEGEGKCSMCGREGDMSWHSNEFPNEWLCDACFVKFKDFGKKRKDLMRTLISKWPYVALIIGEDWVSERLKNRVEQIRIERARESEYRTEPLKLSKTISNKAKFHQSVGPIDFSQQVVKVRVKGAPKEITELRFNGEYYYSNYPKYGWDVLSISFKKLIEQHLQRKGDVFMQRDRGEFYLAFPLTYPAPKNIYPTVGCIVVSNRSVLTYVNGKIRFYKLYMHYLRKRIADKKTSPIKSENKLREKDGRPKIPIPKKYSEGTLGRYIQTQNHVVSRSIVEIIKKDLNGSKGSIALIDYTHLNPKGEAVTPIISLNSEIKNKLDYDSLMGKSVWYQDIQLKCPKCGEPLPIKEPDENGRLVIRDILLSKINRRKCICKHTINPLIVVAKSLMEAVR